MKKLLSATLALALLMVPVSVMAQSYDGETIEAESDGETYNITVEADDEVTLEDVGGTGGTLELEFTENASGSVVVTQSSTRPSEAPVAPEGSVNLYFEVELTGGLTNDDIGTAIWTFSVDKSFIEGIDGATEDNIFLNHYDGSSWERLPTRQVSETSTTYVYEAEVDNFSPFAVTAVAGLTNAGSPYLMGVVLAVASLAVVGGAYRLSRQQV